MAISREQHAAQNRNSTWVMCGTVQILGTTPTNENSIHEEI